MSPRKILRYFLAILLAAALVTSGSLHAIIPHTHTHQHGPSGEVSVVWKSLHHAISHESKKTPTAHTAIILVFSILAAVASVRVPAIRFAHSFTISRVFDPMRGQSLSRGLLKYRAFG